MCGFAGFIDFQSRRVPRDLNREILVAMSEQLSRRGPDDEQLLETPPLSLVFRRLSVIDLLGGSQPIWNENHTMCVAVNGEIYNHLELRSQLRSQHRFSTGSDAEIVLHLYEELGPKALHYLNGMFAIALWDGDRQQLFLARDRLGIKPLYYSQVDSLLIFGSTLASVLVHPLAPRYPQFQDLTNLSATTSHVRGINRLAGGHYLLFDERTRKATPICYWNLADYLVTEPIQDSRTPEDYCFEYRELFVDSVKKRLMSDVPVGACLSGGLDSGAVVAVAAQAQSDLHCFTIVDENTMDNGDAEVARQICQQLQLPFYPVRCDSENLLEQLDFSLETFEYFIGMIDSPRFNVEWFYKHELHRYAKTQIPELKVMLLGQGSDEFAGGYSTPEDFQHANWQEYTEKLAEMKQQDSQRQRPTSLKNGSYLFDRTIEGIPPNCTEFQKEMLMKIYSLQDYNLWHEDRSSMSQSIEARVPFLDHRLVEYLASIPPQHHFTLFWNKKIIREMASDWLHNDWVERSKSGGSEPLIYYRMKEKIIKRIWQPFKEKYIDCGERNLFKSETLMRWFEQVNNAEDKARDFLLNAMAMTVFKQLCLTKNLNPQVRYLYRGSVL